MEFRKADAKFYGCKLKEIMEGEDLPLIEKNANIKRVLAELVKRTHVWVTERRRSKKVVGVITEYDVLNILSPGMPTIQVGLPDMRTLHRGEAEEVMTKKIVSCAPDETVKGALDRMMTHDIRRLPVVDKDNNILGEVGLHQLIKKFSAIKGWK